ncbi:MAG: STAS domain-containing protein [Planctomycetaceae bacterium]
MGNPQGPEITRQGQVTLITLGPTYENIDEGTLEALQSSLFDIAEKADPPFVVLDLSHTKFFGSGFIEIMFRMWNRLETQRGGKFAIAGLTQYCAEVLQITHLDKLWKIFAGSQDAVAALGE